MFDTSSILIHICATSFVSKMKKNPVLGVSLSLSFPLRFLSLFNAVASG